MAPSIRIETENAHEGLDLVQALARSGLIGQLVAGSQGWDVEVISRRRPGQLLGDLSAALDEWLDGRPRRRVSVRMDGRRYVLENHSGLRRVESAAGTE